ncbi:hypothetical protein KVP70_33245 [Duganella sp. HSC-15S17]|uniref:Uncharacterized protein n=1 Tax=Duganella violaceipulchra TaxID=2849652 RepID=A0AA41HGN6_9BURK|nr:hypothetical protein [Duganella violaceicalia]MBV6325775.1 hypothetical protein [Duganella violaceicalia]
MNTLAETTLLHEIYDLDDAAALETVRLMNTAIMNGNPVNGRLNVASTMVRQNSSDFERYYEPISGNRKVASGALGRHPRLPGRALARRTAGPGCRRRAGTARRRRF